MNEIPVSRACARLVAGVGAIAAADEELLIAVTVGAVVVAGAALEPI